MKELEINEIRQLAALVAKSVDALVAYKELLSDFEKLDLLDSARKLETLFKGKHPRYLKSERTSALSNKMMGG